MAAPANDIAAPNGDATMAPRLGTVVAKAAVAIASVTLFALTLVALATSARGLYSALELRVVALAASVAAEPGPVDAAAIERHAPVRGPASLCAFAADGQRIGSTPSGAASECPNTLDALNSGYVHASARAKGVTWVLVRERAAFIRAAVVMAAPMLITLLVTSGIGVLLAVRYARRLGQAFTGLRDAARAVESGTTARPVTAFAVAEFAELRVDIERAAHAVRNRMDEAVRELDERQRAEAALQRSEQRLRRIIDEIPLAVFALDASGRLLFANRGAANLFGRTPESLVDNPEPLLREPWLGTDRTLVVGDGDARRVLEIHRARLPLDGDAVGTLVVGNDVTDARVLQMRLNEASRMQAIGQLAGGLAHEFNILLTPISGHAELLKSRAAGAQIDGDALRAPLDAITSAAGRARDLIRQVLSFSRTTEQLFERVPTAVDDLTNEVGMLMRGSLPSSIELRVQVERGLPLVLADAGQLHQVLVNLCTNAAQAIAARVEGERARGSGDAAPSASDPRPRGGGRIDVIADTVHIDDLPEHMRALGAPGVRIRVIDDGDGMPANVSAHVFEPFFSTKRGEQGTGLGLAVAKGIVEGHDGTIRVDSTPRVGTCFEILLPGLSDSARPEDRGSTGAPNGTPRPRLVLLVDDDEAVLLVTGEMLRALGYEVATASGGEQALEMLADAKFAAAVDLVITDNSMPGMDGHTLGTHIRARFPRLPIVMLTGLIDIAPSAPGVIDLQLLKPVGLVELDRALAGLLAAA